ncbi:MAG: carboxypeptidase-like regulatory domain-containing protein [Fulvivirga sp.]|uniref:carboxypeptidase-like regulatory domain-containing protein n=1 Tax=Fulvivirga sp. TaxID=1931237 RepID=UPI0032EDCF59
MRTLLIYTLAIFFLNNAYAQHKITGVINNTENQPVPYAQIGILSTSIGCITDENGEFTLALNLNKHLGETFTVSAIGYKSQNIKITKDLTHLSITLQPITKVLDPIVINSKGLNLKTYGTKPGIAPGGTSILSVSGGSALALKIYPDQFPVLVQNVKVNILENQLKEFQFRIHFFAIDSVTGLPGKDLVNQNLILKSTIQKGYVTLDLKPYDITLNQAFYLAVEWVNDSKTKALLQSLIEKPIEWLTGEIENNKMVTYDKNGKVLRKVKLTKEQLIELEERRVPHTIIRTRAASSIKCYFRRSIYSDWKEYEDVMIAEVEVLN